MKLSKPYFRVGVGAILYTNAGDIICFQRADNENLWQFPQGGVDAGEDFENTLWRELFKETAISKDMVVKSDPYPDWTIYEYPGNLRHQTGDIMGQVHRWWFLKLKPDCLPNLEQAEDKEFIQCKQLSMDDFLAIPSHDFKLPTYQKLARYFFAKIIKT